MARRRDRPPAPRGLVDAQAQVVILGRVGERADLGTAVQPLPHPGEAGRDSDLVVREAGRRKRVAVEPFVAERYALEMEPAGASDDAPRGVERLEPVLLGDLDASAGRQRRERPEAVEIGRRVARSPLSAAAATRR